MTHPIKPGLKCQSLDKELLHFDATDQGNALSVNLMHSQEFAINQAFGLMWFDGKKWVTDGAEQHLDALIVDTLAYRAWLSIRSNRPDIAKKCIADNRIINAVKARYLQLLEIRCPVEDFEQHHHLLNCANGVINLRTGELLPHDPSYRFLHCIPISYNPAADRNQLLSFFASAIENWTELQDYFQMAMGYSLTGDTSQECMFYCWGKARAGKGTMTQMMLNTMGSLAASVDFDTFTREREGNDQNFDLARLHGKRLVIANESKENRRINEKVVKNITGNDRITAAFKHKDPFEFQPLFKIWLGTNFPIKASPDDAGFWTRVRLFRFPYGHEEDADTSFKQQMLSQENLEAFLAWAVEGAVKYFSSGAKLLTPAVMKEQIRERRNELDSVAQWLEQCTNPSDHVTGLDLLFASYKNWCNDNEFSETEIIGSKRKFGDSLESKGYARGRIAAFRGHKIELINDK